MSSKVLIKGAHCLRQEETAKIFIIKEEIMAFLGALLCLCGMGAFAMMIAMVIADLLDEEEEEDDEDERRK